MSKVRMQRCFNCGEELGMYEHEPGDIEACGARDCQREMRAAHREQDEAAQERARDDNYERYR